MKVSLLERSERLGGLISTQRTEWGLSESAIHSFPASGVMRALCEDLGVELVQVRDDSKARFIVRDGKAQRFPGNLSSREFFQAFLRAYFVLADSRVPPEDVTVEAWAKRHLGKTALDYLIDPMIAGIYGTSPAELSALAAFPRFAVPPGHSLLSRVLARKIREPRSPAPREKKPVSAPKEGMSSLVDALEMRLRERLGSRLRTGAAVADLTSFPNVVLCVPAGAAAELLASVDPSLSGKLRAVRYAPLVSVTAFLDREGFDKPPRGLGVLMPSKEQRRCLGILFNSSAFPGRVADESSLVSITGFFGQPVASLEPSESELQDGIVSEMRSLFGYRSNIARIAPNRWKQAIPKYDRALLDCWAAARSGWCVKPGRVLFGNIAGQVALRGMAEAASLLAMTLQP